MIYTDINAYITEMGYYKGDAYILPFNIEQTILNKVITEHILFKGKIYMIANYPDIIEDVATDLQRYDINFENEFLLEYVEELTSKLDYLFIDEYERYGIVGWFKNKIIFKELL